MSNLTPEAKQIRERIFPDNPSLNIKRIPQNSFKQFIKLSNEEFCSDYGMCLRECINALEELRLLKKLLYSGNFKIEFIKDESKKDM